jgi:hypothetical protein
VAIRLVGMLLLIALAASPFFELSIAHIEDMTDILLYWSPASRSAYWPVLSHTLVLSP